MKHTVKEGDRFRLGAWEWRVIELEPNGHFTAGRETTGRYIGDGMAWNAEDAEKLEWIKPEPTFTRDQVEAIKKWHSPYGTKLYDEDGKNFLEWLDAHIEKE